MLPQARSRCHHVRCTVVKLHGDYLDPRIRNTDEELASYDGAIDRLLDRILADYGLITCGWSGEWDIALRAAIERCPNRRFTTYWMNRGEPSERARQLVELRQAQIITIAGADQAFQELAEKVEALAEHHRPHPLPAPLAVASLKQYLPEDRHHIRLHDLIMSEVERCYETIIDEGRFPLGRTRFANGAAFDAELLRQVRSYEALCEIILALFVHGCYWSEPQHDRLWVKGLERLAQPHRTQGQFAEGLLSLRRYPALPLERRDRVCGDVDPDLVHGRLPIWLHGRRRGCPPSGARPSGSALNLQGAGAAADLSAASPVLLGVRQLGAAAIACQL